VPQEKVVKYLGLFLDSKLDWKANLNSKIAKAKAKLMMAKKALSHYFGPRPKLVRWAFTGIIRPALAYGAIVWGHTLDADIVIARLKKLNRLAMLAIAPVRYSTPTAGMEVIYNIPPLDIYIKGLGLRAYLRTLNHNFVIWDGLGRGFQRGHRFKWNSMLDRNPLGNVPRDNLPPGPEVAKKYVINCSKTSEQEINEIAGTICYTDGSKIKDQTGYGFFIQKATDSVTISGYLGVFATVFQAEIKAILEAAKNMIESQTHGSITILSDSQAALLALDSHRTKSHLVKECKDVLNELTNMNNSAVTLRWVKAHVGLAGNEQADHLAKMGTMNMDQLHGPEPFLGVPDCTLGELVEEMNMERWSTRWKSAKEYRQTKLWFPELDPGKSKQITNNSRNTVSTMVQGITGHNFLMRHQHLISYEVSPKCRACSLDSEESFEHLSTDCPATLTLRQSLWNTPDGLPLDDMTSWSVLNLLAFLRSALMGRLMDPNVIE
jgi:ribonuclease HI